MSLDTFFATIKNGAWHSIDELSNQLAISTAKLTELSRFLSNSGLIKYEEDTRRIMIQPFWTLLLPAEEQPKEAKSIVANFVISPHASIDIQSAHISNLSNVEVEVTLRLDNKIREVAINV